MNHRMKNKAGYSKIAPLFLIYKSVSVSQLSKWNSLFLVLNTGNDWSHLLSRHQYPNLRQQTEAVSIYTGHTGSGHGKELQFFFF